MSDEPDFTENTDLSAVLAPEDLADLEARMQTIASRPAPTAENRQRFADIRDGSQERVEAKIAAAEEVDSDLFFDTSTPEGHIDAVTFVRATLLGIGMHVLDAMAVDDQIAVSEMFQEAHNLWESVTPAVQFNVLLEFLMAVAGSAAAQEGEDSKEAP